MYLYGQDAWNYRQQNKESQGRHIAGVAYDAVLGIRATMGKTQENVVQMRASIF